MFIIYRNVIESCAVIQRNHFPSVIEDFITMAVVFRQVFKANLPYITIAAIFYFIPFIIFIIGRKFPVHI